MNDAVIFVSEGDAVEVDDPSVTWFGSGRSFARSHGKKETVDGYLGDDCKGGVSESCLVGARELVHCLEELRRERFLALSWWVYVGECVE
jgi:hypothetical protein